MENDFFKCVGSLIRLILDKTASSEGPGYLLGGGEELTVCRKIPSSESNH